MAKQNHRPVVRCVNCTVDYQFFALADSRNETPRWGNPTNSVNNAAFGQILSASGERELQSAVRITF